MATPTLKVFRTIFFNGSNSTFRVQLRVISAYLKRMLEIIVFVKDVLVSGVGRDACLRVCL